MLIVASLPFWLAGLFVAFLAVASFDNALDTQRGMPGYERMAPGPFISFGLVLLLVCGVLWFVAAHIAGAI